MLCVSLYLAHGQNATVSHVKKTNKEQTSARPDTKHSETTLEKIVTNTESVSMPFHGEESEVEVLKVWIAL